jgi:hypothetical protein
MKDYKTYALGEECNEVGSLIAENQEVGLGGGAYILRDLYERYDGSRYSVAKTETLFREVKVVF